MNLKYLWNYFRAALRTLTPVPRWRIPLLIVFGAIAGFGIHIIIISNALSYMSEEPETCVNCHVMQSQFATWNHSSHRERASCTDCHLPHDNILNHYFAKGRDGMKDVFLFTFRMENNVPHSTSETKEIILQNCLRCHGEVHRDLDHYTAAAGNGHGHQGWEGKQCWDCHREVPHGRAKGLPSVVRPETQLHPEPIPGWLQKQLNLADN